MGKERWQIGADGKVKIGKWTLVFPDFFRGFYLYRLSEDQLALVNPDEIWEFVVIIKERIIEEEQPDSTIIPVFSRGLLRPVPRGGNRLRFAEDFKENHSVAEVKRILNGELDPPLDASEKDWERLTQVANKYGIDSLIKHFKILWTAGKKYELPDLIKTAVFCLLDVSPTPTHAFSEVEKLGVDPEE